MISQISSSSPGRRGRSRIAGASLCGDENSAGARAADRPHQQRVPQMGPVQVHSQPLLRRRRKVALAVTGDC